MDDEEIIRLRELSAIRFKRIQQEQFDEWYQQQCDAIYWKEGQCCAGCDYWVSDGAYSGQCRANGMVSGDDVMKSMGVIRCTHDFGPGFPFTQASEWCGKFKDDFDWAALDLKYLEVIGAVRNGRIKDKPRPPVTHIYTRKR